MRSLAFPLSSLVCLALFGCTSAPEICSAPLGTSKQATALAREWTSFGVDLYAPAVAATGTGKNAIMSPFSVAATLQMLDVGAKGATASQIEKALELPGNAASLRSSYAALTCGVETDGTSNDGAMSIANTIWGQKGQHFVPSFLSELSKGYGAPLQRVDFENDASGATDTIDAWVSRQTNGKIPKLLQPGDVDSSTRLVLVDALYFKGTWDKGFDPSKTAPRPFTLSNGQKIETPTMDGHVTLRTGSYGSTTNVFELGYKGGTLAMDFLVPQGSLADFESTLTPAGLSSALAGLSDGENHEILLPKFSFSTHLALAPVLQKLGVEDAFDPNKADLSGIDGARDLFVSAVVHQAMVEVDEQGTVAAAATAGTVTVNAIELPLAIDRPFMFLIRDTKNGALLFIGRVEDPRQTS